MGGWRDGGEGTCRSEGRGVFTSWSEMTAESMSPRIIHTRAKEVHNPTSL